MNLSHFRDHLAGQGLADRTINAYLQYLRRLTTWANLHGIDPDTIAPHQIRAWADTTIPLSWASRKQARAAIQRWAQTVGRTDQPHLAIRVPAKPQPRPRPLTRPQTDLLRDTALMVGGRAGLATILSLYTGARTSEIAGMRWDGIDLEAGTIRWWRPKRQDWHQIPMHPILAETLHQQQPASGEGHLFVGNNGRPHVGPPTIWGWIRNLASTVDLQVTPQQLRSTAGWKVLEATGSIELAASLLGHSDLSTTRRHYTGTASQQRLNDAIAAL